VVQLQLVRNLTSSGVSYDTSTRTYQLPVIFGNSYEAYALSTFGAKAYNSSAAVVTYNPDGTINSYPSFVGDKFFTNLQAWVLGFNAASATSKPLLKPAKVAANPAAGTLAYYGFIVTKSHVLVPPYDYINNEQPTVSYDSVQCSTDGGKTWAAITSTDPNWTVINTADVASPPNASSDHGTDTGPITTLGQIGIISKWTDTNGNPVLPPGTTNYQYTIGLSLNTTPAWPPQVPPYPAQ